MVQAKASISCFDPSGNLKGGIEFPNFPVNGNNLTELITNVARSAEHKGVFDLRDQNDIIQITLQDIQEI